MLNKDGSSMNDDFWNHRIEEVDRFEEYPWRQNEDDLLIKKVLDLAKRWDSLHHIFINGRELI